MATIAIQTSRPQTVNTAKLIVRAKFDNDVSIEGTKVSVVGTGDHSFSKTQPLVGDSTTFELKEFGVYQVSATSASDGVTYAPAGPVIVSATNPEPTVELQARQARLQVVVTKDGEFNGASVSGVDLEVRDASDRVIYTGKTTGGALTIPVPTVGSYTVRMTQPPPKGHKSRAQSINRSVSNGTATTFKRCPQLSRFSA